MADVVLPYVDLHIHSEFSLTDSILRVGEIVAHAKQQGAHSVALTDRNNVYGAVKFYKAARAAGVKPILGCDLTVRDKEGALAQLVLLAQHHAGFVHLCELVSAAYQYDQDAQAVAVDWKRLTSRQCEGLIALSGGMQGDVAQLVLQNRRQEALERIRHWQAVFGDRYYLQIARHGVEGEAQYIEACQAFEEQCGVASVATNLACFGNRAGDFEVHEARICISGGYQLIDPRRPRPFTQNHCLQSRDKMNTLFADAPMLLQNSEVVAKRCNTVLTLGENYLPDFPVPEGQSIEQFLVDMAEQGLERRLTQLFDEQARYQEKAPEYRARLQQELAVINQMGFAGYFLIVADFIRWAKHNEIAVGPGRGSGAGSLVAYALEITDLDPLAYDLLFERFLNPERVSMPDFDIDFCMEKRDRVIEYVADKYGSEKVSQIATFGTMAAKAVIRDVGRVMGMPYPVVDRLSKMVPNVLKIKLLDALGKSEKSQNKPEMVSEELIEQYDNNEEAKQLLETCLRLEGLARNVGKHAGGVVIAPTKLSDFSALYAEHAGAGVSSQFDKDDIEAVGLVKFDFLGLRTLTVIDWALAHVNKRRRREGLGDLDLTRVSLEDKATYDLLKSGQTTGVFQLESRGMKELILRIKPDNFEEIVALVALFRPGPLQSGMVDDFIRRKHGLAEVIYPHPDLEPILNTTYGVMVYQEQVMQVAQVLAKYSLGEADILRRAMGKKKAEEMATQREIFTSKAVAQGLKAQLAAEIFDLMAKFAEYGFNKSHSAAYALLSYQTAWLKTHYPAEFLAAVLTSEMDHTDKIVRFIDECQEMGIEVLPPSINQSHYAFTVNEAGAIVYGLGAIKGVGENAINAIVAEREAGGAFDSLEAVCQRLNLKKLNRKTLETLIYAGAFDVLTLNRGAIFAALPEMLQLSEQIHKDEQTQQHDMFALFGNAPSIERKLLKLDDSNQWDKRLQLEYEKKTLGLFLSDHPIKPMRQLLLQMCPKTIAELNDELEQQEKPLKKGAGYEVWVGGLVLDVRKMKSKKGHWMAFLTLDDLSGRCECSVFGDLVQQADAYLQADAILVIRAKVEYAFYREQWQLIAQEIMPIERAQFQLLKALQLSLVNKPTEKTIQIGEFLAQLKDSQGIPMSIRVELAAENVAGMLQLPGVYQIDAQAFKTLEQMLGKEAMFASYITQ